jgi:hypothetical protein
MVESFARLGMTRTAAETAAEGRGGTTADRSKSVREVRESKAADDPLGLGLWRQLDEIDEMLGEIDEMQRRRIAREIVSESQRWKNR